MNTGGDYKKIDPAPESEFSRNNPDQPFETTFMSNDSGAGANASPGSLFMPYLPSSPLTELVWSPITGPSNVELVPKSSTRMGTHLQMNGQDFDGNESHRSGPPMVLSVRDPSQKVEIGTGNYLRGTHEIGGSSYSRMNQTEDCGEGKRNNEFQMLKIADTRENQLPTFPGILNRETLGSSSVKWGPTILDYAQLEQKPAIGYILSSREKRMKEAEEAQRKACTENKLLESTSENDLSRQVPEVKVNSRPAKETPRTRRKGKERGEDSCESVESCNSVKSVAATGTKRRNFEHDPVDEGKGVKRQMHGLHGVQGLTSIGGRDSSFMNWISNMMKGSRFLPQNTTPLGEGPLEKKSSASDKTQEPRSKPVGFQSMFQSLYSPKEEVRENRVQNAPFEIREDPFSLKPCSLNRDPNEEVRENRAPNTQFEIGDPFSLKPCSLNRDPNEEVRENRAPNTQFEIREDPFSLNTCSLNCYPNEEVRENRVPMAQFEVGQGSKEAEPPTETGLEGKTREELLNLEADMIFQFHARNINAHLDFVEARRPEKRPHFEDFISFGHNMELSSANREKSTLQRGNRYPTCEGGEIRSNASLTRMCSSSQMDKNLVSGSVEQSRPSFFATGRAPEGLFDAVRRVRLSRHEIMTWMKSRLPVSHVEGYFLRIRLGRWEEGLGGTGYHAGRIIGMKENTEQDSKRSVLLRVGGLTCYIESQFVSNGDFLENELLSWWSVGKKEGDKMPSVEELRAKAEAKPYLGL